MSDNEAQDYAETEALGLEEELLTAQACDWPVGVLLAVTPQSTSALFASAQGL